jgi:hypothetical protein
MVVQRNLPQRQKKYLSALLQQEPKEQERMLQEEGFINHHNVFYI